MTDIVKDFRVESEGLDNNRLDVLWDWASPTEVLSYEVWIERSGSIGGPFSTIAKTYSAVSYTDWEADYDITQVFYYRLRVVKRDSGATSQLTEAKTFEGEPDLIAQEIRRREGILLREFTGVPILYYPLRTIGDRCPDCWSASEGQRIRSHCTTCFDTGYLTGFYTPLLMRMNIHEEQNSLSQNAETDEVPVRIGTGFVPAIYRVQFGDLIVEQNNERWIVSSYDRTEKLRVRVSWRLRLHQLLEQDVRFRVPLPSPDIFSKLERSREHTRPYTLNP